MNKDEALCLALEALEKISRTQYHIETPPIESLEERMRRIADQAITTIKAALEAKDEPVAVKHMMRWVDNLKRQSDNGQHMNIPSGLSAGTCWELANELEQFIKSPPQRTWVGLTDEEINALDYSETRIEFVRAIEAKLKEKNT
jgi:myosin heavy subunit